MYDLIEEIDSLLSYLYEAVEEDDEDTLAQEYDEKFKQFEYLTDLVTEEFEDEVIVMTPKEIEDELSRLASRRNSLYAKVSSAANTDAKLAAQEDFAQEEAHIDILTYI